MASEEILEDIDEKFLQCSICLCQLKNPKSLPCLHRYCRDCLVKTVTERDRDIQCPTCREIYPLPHNGVDGFKTDFNTKNIIEYVQLKNSVKDVPIRACVACKKKLRASAYCFRCRDFLCQSCHEFHQTNTIVKDHRPHIFSVTEMETRNLTMEKLASLKEAPRCGTHPDKLSDLCCTTCGNQPICVPCIYGVHQGHNLKEVTSLAKLEREKLTKKTAELMQYKEKIYRMQEELKKSKEELDLNVTEKRAELQNEFDLRENKIKEEIKDKDGALERRKRDLDGMMRKKTSVRKQELEREMKMAQDKYDRFCRDEKESMDAEFQKLLQENERDKTASYQELEVINKEFSESLASLQAQEKANSDRIKELSDHFDDIVKRFEIVTTTASSIVAAKHDWTDVQCITDICTAQGSLIKDMKKDFSDLGILSDVTVGGLSLASLGRGERVSITEREESVVGIEGVTGRGWDIRGITGGKDGSIVITGQASYPHSHITVISTKGTKIKQNIMRGSAPGIRFCDFLSQSKIATVCWLHEIGIYDIRDGTYRKANIRDIISTWPSGEYPWCVTVDHSNDHIMVGGTQMKDVYVFDYDLKYINTITLPGMMRGPSGMVVHKGSLLVCNGDNGRACAVTTEEGSACEIKYEFPEPDVGGASYKPWSVCTDQHGYIYMLWRAKISGQERSILVQYSQDGGQLLQSRLVDCKDKAFCITTVDTEQGEKLLLATQETGKLITYGLST